ncbi:MAG: thioredoxin [Lachnospiraceae bacterium]|jgi:thioredoxin 1|nr:thioredoxin [Lachnospiraceae bacterium]
MAAVNVTKDNFQAEVLESDKPVLVDFWASWCGPCKMLSPIVEQVAESVQDVKICKVNVDDEQELAERYNIMSIPALKVFKNGEVVNEGVGFMPREKVEELIRV